jgi:hypothetical protein
MNPNLILGKNEKCSTCYHTMIHSFLSFEVLPLVEFKVPAKLPHAKVQSLLSSEKDTAEIERKLKKLK